MTRTPKGKHAKSPPTAPPASPRRHSAVPSMSPEAKLAWNLKVLRRHDPSITRIFDQAPYGVLYTFNNAHAQDPDGGKGKKYEGTWDKSGIEGTVFLFERGLEPRYGFFLLNRGGTSSVVQMFHHDDTIEIGADTRFLTFRPGLWDRATTPYVEPFSRCSKPSVICLWLSDETAGPRFAFFMNKAKEHLLRAARSQRASGSTPPLTPLSQINYIPDGEDDPREDTAVTAGNHLRQKQAEFYRSGVSERQMGEAEVAISSSLAIEKLFAGLSGSYTTSQQAVDNNQVATAPSSQSIPNLSTNLLNKPHVSSPSNVLEAKAPTQGSLSLLDQIFASAATEHVDNLRRPLQSGISNTVEAPVTPPTFPSSVSSAYHFSDTPRDDEDEDEVVLMPNRSTIASVGEEDYNDHYQELEAPSPSLIPNPLHTPVPLLSRRQNHMFSRSHTRSPSPTPNPARERQLAMRGSTPSDIKIGTSVSLSEGSGGIKGPVKLNQYIPRNTGDGSRLESGLVSEVLSDQFSKRQNDKTVLSKYAFVSEILTLIHKEPSFVEDLYAKYLDSKLNQSYSPS